MLQRQLRHLQPLDEVELARELDVPQRAEDLPHVVRRRGEQRRLEPAGRRLQQQVRRATTRAAAEDEADVGAREEIAVLPAVADKVERGDQLPVAPPEASATFCLPALMNGIIERS